jgi:hypothetical protein
MGKPADDDLEVISGKWQQPVGGIQGLPLKVIEKEIQGFLGETEPGKKQRAYHA